MKSAAKPLSLSVPQPAKAASASGAACPHRRRTRLLAAWMTTIGFDASLLGAHSLRNPSRLVPGLLMPARCVAGIGARRGEPEPAATEKQLQRRNQSD
jgi:hypothetical protein